MAVDKNLMKITLFLFSSREWCQKHTLVMADLVEWHLNRSAAKE